MSENARQGSFTSINRLQRRAAWRHCFMGAVSLRQVRADRVAALAAGADDEPGILIDHIEITRKSAQSGLPIYRLVGGLGYVWAANWSRRGRGSIRMVAIDPTRLPGGVAVPTESAPRDSADAIITEAPAGVTLAPQRSYRKLQQAARSDVASQVLATRAVEPSDTPSQVRVVGPPINFVKSPKPRL